MKPVVAILAQGGMGAAVGARLVSRGLVVKTPLAGRSAASRERASKAGMTDASAEEIAACNLVLSIVPTADALAAAEAFAPALSTASKKPIYVDCNAISPRTALKVADIIGKTGCPFVDAGIIGLPPKPEGNSPKFFACGPGYEAFSVLKDFGIDVRPVDGPIGAASTLKMCYGGITKGVIAVGAAMVLAASKAGAGKALLDELQASQPALATSYSRSLPDMLPKAGRWVGEMEEISSFVGEGSAEAEIYQAFAAFYQRLSDQSEDVKQQAAMIGSFFPSVG